MRTLILLFLLVSISCQNTSKTEIAAPKETAYKDIPFDQEYHEAHTISNQKTENDVRDITVDHNSTVWIATANGIFKKEATNTNWQPIIKGEEKGPSYAVEVDASGTVWMGTWNGVYQYKNNTISKVKQINSPISSLCSTNEGVYALGPKGIWLNNNSEWNTIDYKISKAVRDVKSDGKNGLWIATDVGLYHCKNGKSTLYQDNSELLSCYLSGIDFDSKGDLWAGGLGGVTIRNNAQKLKTLTPKEGIPSVEVNSVDKAPDGTMWIGTKVGVVRYSQDGSHSLRFSKRWLVNDDVRAIAFDKKGTAWIATANGVSAIKKKKMTLADKESHFYDMLMKRHIREPWIAGISFLPIAGDLNSSEPADDDNDGQYTSLYLVMESLKYAVTKDEVSKKNARKALDFLFLLQTITETEGFFARTVIPATWKNAHDKNRTYTKKQLAEYSVESPRSKKVENRWRVSKDEKWIWKGDTSSDEMCGHMLAFMFYNELVADAGEKEEIKQHVMNIMDYIIKNDYNFVDIDGKHTQWGVWSPKKLNHDPEWAPERGMNSLEMLSFLKFTHHITGKQKYQDEYLRLINEEKYLENIERIHNQNEAWKTYIDAFLSTFVYPSLMKYEDDPKLRAIYSNHMNQWFNNFKNEKSPFFNYFYCYAADKIVETENTAELLIDAPLNMIDWHIDHTKREDIQIVRKPILAALQTSELVTADMRATIRWDKNPWDAIQGSPHREREPVYWLLPYWLGKYVGAIE